MANHPLDRGRPLVSGLVRRGDPVQVMANRAAFLQERLTIERGRGGLTACRIRNSLRGYPNTAIFDEKLAGFALLFRGH
jgi:hypothetical protein